MPSPAGDGTHIGPGDRVGAVPGHPCIVTSRRTTLGGVLVGLGLVAGCDLDPGDSATSPTPAATSAAAPAGPPDDATLVEQTLVDLGETSALLAAVTARFPRLATTLVGLEALHSAHRETLGGAGPTPVGDAGDPVDARQALGLVRARELRLQNRLADGAVAADSGALARLLACMSAGVAQQLAVLPGTPGAAPRDPGATS